LKRLEVRHIFSPSVSPSLPPTLTSFKEQFNTGAFNVPLEGEPHNTEITTLRVNRLERMERNGGLLRLPNLTDLFVGAFGSPSQPQQDLNEPQFPSKLTKLVLPSSGCPYKVDAKALPRSLVRLHIPAPGQLSIVWKHLPNTLKHLGVHLLDEMVETQLMAIPKSLEVLWLSGKPQDPSLMFPHLPQGLVELFIRVTCLDTRHFEHIPRRLQTLEVTNAREPKFPIDLDVVTVARLLPRTLLLFVLVNWTHCVELKREWVRLHPRSETVFREPSGALLQLNLRLEWPYYERR